MPNDEPQTYGILLRRPGSGNVYIGPGFNRIATFRTGADHRWPEPGQWALNASPSIDGWTIGYGPAEEVLADARQFRNEVDAAIAVLERAAREAVEHAAWIAEVEAKFVAAIRATRRGESAAWGLQVPVGDGSVNDAGLAEYAPDWSQDLQDAVAAADWPDDGYPFPDADGSYESLQRWANVRVLAEMARGMEDMDERFIGPPVQRATPAERWVRAERQYDEMTAEAAERERREAEPAARMAADPDLARMEAVFTAAKEACRDGHDAGCTYGGMSSSHGYWLPVEECTRNHGGTCDLRIACDGAEAETGFAGREAGDWIWVVAACQPCADAYVAKRPEYARPTPEENAARDRDAEAFLAEMHASAPPMPTVQYDGPLAMLDSAVTATARPDPSGVNLNQDSLRRFLPPAPTPGDAMGDEETETQTADSEPAETVEPKRCREHASGLWIHNADHDCPSFLRGKLPNRRRMRP